MICQPFEEMAEKVRILKMDHEQRGWINKYLMPDEYVVWNGRPGKGHLLTPNDVFMIPFSIMWCGFAIVWETNALTSAPFFFALWGIPFVCVGLYMVFGRFILKWYMRKETVYVITNKRIFSFRRNQIQTLDYHVNPTRNITHYRDGTGTIRFSSTSAPHTRFPDFFTSSQSFRQNDQYFELENIPDVDRVLQILSN